MKRTWVRAGALATGALLGLSGCLSGSVSVQPVGVLAGSGSSGPASPPVGHESGDSSSSSGASVANAPQGPVDTSSATTVYFESLSSSGALGEGLPGVLTGLGFLSAQATSGTPFGFRFLTAGEGAATVVYWKPVLVSGVEDVAWIQQSSEGSGANELKILDPSALATVAQLSVPAAQSYALFADATSPQLAGIDASGNLFVLGSGQGASGQGASSKERLGKSGFGPGSQVRWVDGTQELAVTDPVAKTISIFSAANLKAPSASFTGDGFSASPSGKTYLVFASASGSGSAGAGVGQLTAIDAKTGKSHVLAAASTTFAEPQWSGETQVAFVDAPSTGAQVDVLSVASGQIGAQYPVPGSLTADSICPAWVSGSLFFAGVDPQGILAIWTANGASVSEFATPQNTDPVSLEGYSCPKGVSE